jgi:hypothetical protein
VAQGTVRGAALLNMGQRRDLVKQALEESGRTSYRLIWSEYMQPCLSNAGKTNVSIVDALKANLSSLEVHEPVDPAAETTPLAPPDSAAEGIARTPRRTRSRLFHGYQRGDELAAILPDDTRSTVGRLLRTKAASDVWDLLLRSVDAGFLRADNVATTRTASLRLLFPQVPLRYARQFDLEKPVDGRRVRDQILPAAVAHRDAVTANPGDLERIVREYHAAQAAETQAKEAAVKLAAAIAAMAPDEGEIAVYGLHLWPKPDPTMPYTYPQAWHRTKKPEPRVASDGL